MPLRTQVETGLRVRALADGPGHEAPAGLFKRGAAANEDGTVVRVQRHESCRTRTVVRGAGPCRTKADPGLELFGACHPLAEARRTRKRCCHLRKRNPLCGSAMPPDGSTRRGLLRTLVKWSWTSNGHGQSPAHAIAMWWKFRHEVGAQGKGIRIPECWKGVDPVEDERLRSGMTGMARR